MNKTNTSNFKLFLYLLLSILLTKISCLKNPNMQNIPNLGPNITPKIYANLNTLYTAFKSSLPIYDHPKNNEIENESLSNIVKDINQRETRKEINNILLNNVYSKNKIKFGNIPESELGTPSYYWLTLYPNNKGPLNLKGQSVISIDNYLVVFGGCELNGIKCYNDLYFYDFIRKTWIKVKNNGDIPSPRGGHSAVVYGNKMIIYGGVANNVKKNDLYELDLETREWKLLDYANKVEVGRAYHKATMDNTGRMFVFGGHSDTGYSNDLLIINMITKSFEFPSIEGTYPSPREDFIFHYVSSQNKIYLYGGFHEGGDLHDLFILNMSDYYLWKKISIPTKNTNIPFEYSGMGSVLVGDTIYMSGGCNHKKNKCSSDTYSFDTKTYKFSLIKTNINPDKSNYIPRFNFGLVFNRGNLIIYGGCKMDEQCFNDIHLMKTDDLCPNNCNGDINGYCDDKMGCICKNNFYGGDCSLMVECENDCNGRGTCYINGKCLCQEGYTGTACEIKIDYCPQECNKENNGGFCDEEEKKCVCMNGFFGEDCKSVSEDNQSNIQAADFGKNFLSINQKETTKFNMDEDYAFYLFIGMGSVFLFAGIGYIAFTEITKNNKDIILL